MKQLIVMISMIVLGVAIGGMVMSFQETAQGLSNAVMDDINDSITSKI